MPADQQEQRPGRGERPSSGRHRRRRIPTLRRRAIETREAYADGHERPLGSYLVLLGTYSATVAAMVEVVRRRKVAVPAGLGPADLALVTVGTYRLSRLVAKDSVTAALRAPFTQFVEAAGEGEVNEAVRGEGLRHAIGELLTCPFCLAQWFATALVFGLLVAPRLTRMAASVLVASASSDVLQLLYAKLADGQ